MNLFSLWEKHTVCKCICLKRTKEITEFLVLYANAKVLQPPKSLQLPFMRCSLMQSVGHHIHHSSAIKTRDCLRRKVKCAHVFSSVLYCFLNLSLQYPWPTGPQDWKWLRAMKSLENYLLLVKKGEHPDYFTPSLDFVVSFFNPKSNPSSLHFRAGISK